MPEGVTQGVSAVETVRCCCGLLFKELVRFAFCSLTQTVLVLVKLTFETIYHQITLVFPLHHLVKVMLSEFVPRFCTLSHGDRRGHNRPRETVTGQRAGRSAGGRDQARRSGLRQKPWGVSQLEGPLLLPPGCPSGP